MSKSNRIKKVWTENDYTLICQFENGVKKRYDMKSLIENYKIFHKLKEDKELFKKVTVDSGGYGISWNEEIDLAAEEIWENGK